MTTVGGKSWHFGAKLKDLRDDEARVATIGDRQIALCRIAGTVHAFDNICSHEYACLSDGLIEDDEIECPLHQARFHIPTGKALSEPATVALDVVTLPVQAVVVGGTAPLG